jgi:6-phosphogluconolactonase
MTVRVFSDPQVLSLAAAELFVEQARMCLPKGRFSVALAGGETPRTTYEMLARSPFMDQVPWNIVHFFWGDERWVPPSDPQSNERMARQALLDHVPVPDDQIHPIYQAHTGPEDAAWSYDSYLRQFFAGEPHLFDLVFLGLGQNGHTASLFPHTPVLQEQTRWVGQVFLPDQNMYRITLTPGAINRAGMVAFLVSGANKAEILHQVLEESYQPEQWPAQLIQPRNAEITWLVDEAAASKLTERNKIQFETTRR